MTGSGFPAAPPSACPAGGVASFLASGIDPRDARDFAMALAREALAPPPLRQLGGDTMLAVASVPGKIPEEWQDEGAWPFWIAWPHAADAIHAEEMTAAQLRAILAARDAR